MRWIKKRIRGKNINVLDITSIDIETIEDMDNDCKAAFAIQMQLDELHLLSYFPNVHSLILTGGIPNDNDLLSLYSNDIRELVLDYEETDSDEEGIRIDRIASLEYVLSRSNLNICPSKMIDRNADVEILNYYKNGKPTKISIPSSIDICRPKTGVFFSAEAQTPAAVLLVSLLNKIDSYILENDITISRYTDEFDEIGIIPVCMSQEMLDQGFYKERKYVSIKKREADIRLRIDYEAFVKGDVEERQKMCIDNIVAAGRYIKTKSPSFNLQLFIEDVKNALK